MAMIESNLMGPGFFMFFRTEVDEGSSGARETLRRRIKRIEEYEEELKLSLDKEQAPLLIEAKELEEKLVKVEVKRVLAGQQEKIRLESEYKLQLALISESLLQVEMDLAEIDRKRAEISLKARIMRDDDEVIILLYG